MRFLVDECVGPTVAHWLRQEGHEVFSVYEAARGTEDADVLRKANDEKWILITTDKDFGEQVFRERRPHRGILLLRLQDERALNRIRAIRHLLQGHAERLADRFLVVTDTGVRFADGGTRSG